MTLETWLLFVVTEAALCATPGPAVLYVSSQGLARGFGAALAANLGVVTGNVVYFAASAAGLGALILASGEAFFAVKWLGVAYLLWLGVSKLLRRTAPDPATPRPAATRRAYRGGVIVQLTNPKNLVFFVAILPPFIDAQGNVPLQILILGSTSQVIEIATLATYGSLASGVSRWVRRSRVAAWVDRAAGAFLIGAGAGLAWVRRVHG